MSTRTMNIGAESEIVEFKKTTGETKEGIISLTSMLNKNGYGTLWFGVKDNGDVTGQQIGDRTLREISQAIANHIKPQIIPTISLELLDEKNVIKVYVQGTDYPYSAYGKYYMRSADEDRELSPEQLRALMFRKSETDFISNAPGTAQNLTFKMLRTLYAAKGLTINNDYFEENLGLKLNDGKYNLMAVLLSDKNDVSIKVAAFKGKDKISMIRRSEYGFKCLLIAMDQVLSYMDSINETIVEIGLHSRKEEKLFDMGCFREAWINACLHTKWEKMNPPAVYIYEDRIEIISTGGLPEDLTKEEFYKGISRPVNAKLQKIFGQLGYAEQTGHGIPLIISNYGKQAFDLMDNYVNVTIPLNRPFKSPRAAASAAALNDSQKRIYLLLRENPKRTISDLVAESSMSDGYVRKILNQLKALQIIARVGSNKGGFWDVKDTDL